jgi:hypothetical protein
MRIPFPQAENDPMRHIHGFAPWRRRGAIGIMTALMLPALIGFLALALELAQIYNRKAEMQALAESIAISAARKLNGTSDGISEAMAAAEGLLAGGASDSKKLHYQYEHTMTFDDAAIRFSASPNGETAWLNTAAAKASPAGLAYVKVDTKELAQAYGRVGLFLIRALGGMSSMQLSHTAIAGRQRLNLMPLAICAMSKDPAQPFRQRTNSDGNAELTEYGFRRGVSYNLLKLSPYTATPVNYLVDPISLSSNGANFGSSVVGPYICTGTVELPRVIGQTLHLQQPFQIGQFVNHLNSRFNSFNATAKECSAISAPPDTNIKSFKSGAITWMPDPERPVADTAKTSDRLETVADLESSNPASATSYGPLWVFARAVPWSSYKPGQPEPAQGYTPFQASKETWKSLYSPGPVSVNYPTDSKTGAQLPPYSSTQTAGAPSTNYPGVMYRRVLNVPLLSCLAGSSSGSVVAIGRFFMTVPADTNGIYAEFAGVRLQDEASGPVELYQ